MILLIDNYDSFTWNIVQGLGASSPSLREGHDLRVVRNDELAAATIETIDGGRPPAGIIISPGPCTPAEAGVSNDIIARFMGRVPLLGVCLGHQCMASDAGMRVVRAASPVHGKTSMVHHDGRGVFAGMPDPFEAARYHSLVVDESTVPPLSPGGDGWHVSAWCEEQGDDGRSRRVVMGLRRTFADASRASCEGVQFHPESFMTVHGPQLLANFLAMAGVAATAKAITSAKGR
jgi:anthranilate synthase/aminodeoxychorismate synthase-like glutamine amidotransferase